MSSELEVGNITLSELHPKVVSSSTASEVTISGGNATSNGANIALRGSTHGTASSVRFRSGTSETLTINSAGQVEVASGNAHISSATQGSLNFGNISTNTYAKVEYDDTNGNFNINNTRAYPLRFLTDDTERLSITAAGLVDVRSGNLRIIGGNQLQLLNAANDTNVDVINSGGTGVARLGLRVSGSEKVTITSAGTVKIGQSHANEDQTSSLIISKAIASSATYNYITLADTSNNGTEKLRLLFKGRYATGSHANGQEAAYISCNRDGGSDGYGLSFGTGNAADAVDRLTISRTGLATFASEISCTGLSISNQTNTTVGTRASSKFDHFEEGTWSPQFNAATPFTSTPAMDILSAVYTRIGNLVYIQAYIRTDNVNATGGSGQLRINGLPFPAAGSQKFGTISIGEAGSFVSNKFPSGGHIVTGTSYITLTKRPSAGGSLLACDLDSLTTGVTANQNSLLFSGTYTV